MLRSILLGCRSRQVLPVEGKSTGVGVGVVVVAAPEYLGPLVEPLPVGYAS